MSRPHLPPTSPVTWPRLFRGLVPAVMPALLAGCEHSGEGGAPAAGYYDTHYDGGVYHSGPDWNRPGSPPQVEHPIARPPVATPMPRMGGGFRR